MKTGARLLFALVAVLSLASQAPAPTGSAPRLSLDPNAIVRKDRVLTVFVDGVPYGQTVHFVVYQDCNNDGHPETVSAGGCKNPLYERESAKAGPSNVIEDRFEFAKLDPQGEVFPRNRMLWLRAARAGIAGAGESVFGLVDEECSLVGSLVQLFFQVGCTAGPRQTLSGHRGPMGLEQRTFEVQRIAFKGEDKPTSVPGTVGATGATWFDQSTLLLTTRGEPGAPKARPAGVYRLDLKGETLATFWQTDGPQIPAAPFLFKDGRIAYARQIAGAQRAGDLDQVATLVVAREKEVQEEIALPFKLHQILAVDPSARSLLALSLGIEGAQPTFLRIDLETKQVENLGFSPALYQAALRRPGGNESVNAWENAFGDEGWQLSVCTAEGKCDRDLVKRKGFDELSPAWRPDGGELLLLSGKREP